MDLQKLRDLLKGTIDPNLRKEAEEELTKIRKIAGFGPALLQLVMSPDQQLETAERQAAVIFLKNLVTQAWQEPPKPDPVDATIIPDPEHEFSLHDQDKEFIRNSIVDAVVHSPDLIRVQLGVCTLHIIKHDFPHAWPGVVDSIRNYLNSPDTGLWTGALLCLYQLNKNYEYKKGNDRQPLFSAMAVLLPMLYERLVHLQRDQTDHNMLLQKQILKIFYALTQFQFPAQLLSRPVLTEWLEALRQILSRPAVPPSASVPDDPDDRPEMPGWKLYKWALHILNRIFERYGCPSTVGSEHKSFASWYMKTFSGGVLEVLLKILHQYRTGLYVSPRVMHQTLNYIELGLGQAVMWKLVAPHMLQILQDVVFPLMCHSDKDQELWDCDPAEYIRQKNDIYEDLVSPVSAAQAVLATCVRKRKQMLEKVMAFVMSVLNTPNVNPRHKDGAFHMIGSLGSILNKKDNYKEQMEVMLLQYVFPDFVSPHGFLRARALWLLQHFTEIRWTSSATNANTVLPPPALVGTGGAPSNLVLAVNASVHALLRDEAMPVKVEGALAISLFIATQEERMEEILKPQMSNLVRELVKLIQQTESDDLTNVMSKIVTAYSSHLVPIAVDIATQLALTFQQVLNSEDGADERAITAMSLLGTVETLLSAMENSPDIVRQLEPIVLQLVALILNKNVMEFYEEALSLIYNLTSTNISPELWQCYDMLQHLFNTDGFDYFMEMLPSLHNFVTVDTQAFLAVETRLPALCQMCQMILTKGEDEDCECHAAKLLEVVILQCVPPPPVLRDIATLVLHRLLDPCRPVHTTELRTMLLQVVIAGLYTNSEVLLSVLETTPVPNTNTPLSEHFIKQWIEDVDCFLGLHDRKLCVLGLCKLMQLGPERIPALRLCHDKLLPAMLVLFQGLKRAYAAKAAEENNEDGDGDDDDEGDSSDYDNEVLDSDEDELNDNEGFLENVQERIDANASDCPFTIRSSIQDEDDDDDDDEDGDLLSNLDETDLESFSTPLDKDDSDVDEYWVFKTIMQSIEGSPWFSLLTGSLSADQRLEMQEVATLADQRHAAQESRRIQQSGGYNFQQVSVPASFNFGGSFGGA